MTIEFRETIELNSLSIYFIPLQRQRIRIMPEIMIQSNVIQIMALYFVPLSSLSLKSVVDVFDFFFFLYFINPNVRGKHFNLKINLKPNTEITKTNRTFRSKHIETCMWWNEIKCWRWLSTKKWNVSSEKCYKEHRLKLARKIELKHYTIVINVMLAV